MAGNEEARAWRNLAGGFALLAMGAIAVVLIEMAWDAVHDSPGGNRGGKEAADAGFNGFTMGDLSAFALDDAALPGVSGNVSSRFVEECFDPRGMGEASSSDDGAVVGIVADCPASELFQDCADRLAMNGWLQATGGNGSRGTFLRDRGAIRWLFLDVLQVADSAVAVMVLEEGL